jgi:signal transduction histidine kinase
MLKDSSQGLNDTLNELMKVLEVRFNKNMTFDACDLSEVTNHVASTLKGQMVSKNAAIKTDFQKQHLEFPHIYLESIFYNMISNSLKYTKEGVAPVIEIASRYEYGKTVLTFKDNGLGIDLNEHGHNMFKLNKVFHRGFDSKGVGLFMTKTQIETFGGSITVESQVGLGTTFKITL